MRDLKSWNQAKEEHAKFLEEQQVERMAKKMKPQDNSTAVEPEAPVLESEAPVVESEAPVVETASI